MFRKLKTSFYTWMMAYAGSRLFIYIDIYSPDKENITAITFSNSEEYIDRVGDIEL